MTLSPLADKVNEYITVNRAIDGVSCIITGLSGGPDSVALICVLSELKASVSDFPDLIAVHVNHGLRQTASRDEELSRELCDRLHIPFYSVHVDVSARSEELKRGIEETGRILRYEAFHDRLVKYSEEHGVDPGSIRIATAHHRGDLKETFMMNLFRGTGLDGLTSMVSDPSVIRPLLFVSKDMICGYLEERGIDYATDETNLQNDYTRNKWRNEIFPMIAQVSVKDPEQAVFDTYRLLSEDADYLNLISTEEYLKARIVSGQTILIDSEKVITLHKAVSTRVLRLYWKEVFGNLIDFETKHTEYLLSSMGDVKGTLYLDLPFNRAAVLHGGLTGLGTKSDIADISCAMSSVKGFPATCTNIDKDIEMSDLAEGKVFIDVPDRGLSIEVSVIEENETIVYNTFSWICPYGKVHIGVCPDKGTFRNAGSLYDVDIGKLMSDRKVPRDARSRLLAVSHDGRILWIPGIGHSDGFISDKSRTMWNKTHTDHKGRFMRFDIIRKDEPGERQF